MRKLTRRATVLTAGLAASTVMGVAFAAWTSNGSGTGAASSTTSTNSTITAVAPVAADNLYPGAVKSTKVTINNPNPYPVEVTQINAGSSRVNGACAADSVRTDQLGTGATALVKDGGGTEIAASGTGTYTLVLRMSNTATDDCKSLSFVIGDRLVPADDMTASLRSAASTAGNNF